jgi:site-specific DNA-methyltransferase (adenine-specific)
MGKLYTTETAATYLGVTPARVRQLILEERIESEKYGRDHLISEEALRIYELNGRKNCGRPRKKDLRVR